MPASPEHYDNRQRPFLPTFVENATTAPPEASGCAIKGSSQLNRGDPFTAGLDDVFGAVGQGDLLVVRPTSPVRNQPESN